MSRVTLSLSMERPLFAIWFGTPSKLSPNPFHTPLRSGCPSGVRGVTPEGLGGALVLRLVGWYPWGVTTAGNSDSTPTVTMILMQADKRIYTPSGRSLTVGIGAELEHAAIGDL